VLISPDGVAPSRTVGVSASVFLPLHHKVQKFSSGTGLARSPGKVVVKRLCVCDITLHAWVEEKELYGGHVSGGHSVMVLKKTGKDTVSSKRMHRFSTGRESTWQNLLTQIHPEQGQ